MYHFSESCDVNCLCKLDVLCLKLVNQCDGIFSVVRFCRSDSCTIVYSIFFQEMRDHIWLVLRRKTTQAGYDTS
jgi:hypothetical protein